MNNIKTNLEQSKAYLDMITNLLKTALQRAEKIHKKDETKLEEILLNGMKEALTEDMEKLDSVQKDLNIILNLL